MLAIISNTAAQSILHTDTTSQHTMHGTFYHDRFVGRKTSSGERFRQDRYTAAHNSLKFGTLLLVTNPKNGKQVIVRINDRCPRDRVVDMTRLAASSIGVKSSKVTVQVLPERYMELWEKQENLQDILANGQLLEYAKIYFDGKKQYEKNDNKMRLFDIELAKGHNINQQEAIQQLPLYLQDKTGIQKTADGKQQALVLFLSLPYDEVAKILAGLKPVFSNASITPSE